MGSSSDISFTAAAQVVNGSAAGKTVEGEVTRRYVTMAAVAVNGMCEDVTG